ncbi:hypothetical protein CR513_28273, partial [Mucuna pruriens]
MCFPLSFACFVLINQYWEIIILYTFMEGNQSTNYMTKLSVFKYESLRLHHPRPPRITLSSQAVGLGISK